MLVFQAVQLLLSVAVILVSNGEALSQASRFRLCYAVCVVVWAIPGFLFGQTRTLQRFGFLANFAVWINLLIMFITMGVAENSPSLYSAYTASAGYSVNPALVKPHAAGNFLPITHSAGLPNASNFGGSVNGLMNAVYAYSGTQIFLDFMSEMSQPRKFLRSMWGSQLFIYTCYMLYGSLHVWLSGSVRPESVLSGYLTIHIVDRRKFARHDHCDDCRSALWKHWAQR